MLNKSRLKILLICSAFINIAILVRLYLLAATDYESFKDYKNISKYSILDRNNVPLAITTNFYSIYADAAKVFDLDALLIKIKKYLPNMNIDRVKKQWSINKRFVWLDRYVDNPEVISELGLTDVYLIQDSKRLYPQGEITSHIIGLSDLDGNGLSGFERAAEKILDVADVNLTIDIRVQSILDKILREYFKFFDAKFAHGMIVDIETGEILAMVSLPSFDPEDRKNLLDDQVFDRNTQGVYEFGSVMKLANLTMALSNGYKLTDIIDVPEFLMYGRFKIKDVKNNHARGISVFDSFVYSSNKANALLALKVGAEKQIETFDKLGFFEGMDLSMKVGRTLYSKNWSKGTVITSSYGYGIALTPIHLMRGFVRMLTGKKVDLSIIKTDKKKDFERIFDQKVVKSIHKVLRETVEKGYAKKAGVKGMFVGAKTGTANIRINGKYIEKNNLVTCLAAFPLLSDNKMHQGRKYALMVSLESPKANKSTFGFTTAGFIAAPAMNKLIEEVSGFLNIFPER